jgi:TonB family protein
VFTHLIESNAYHSWHLSTALWSAGAHGVLIAAAAVATRTPPPSPVPVAPTREVVYFLPLLPKHVPVEEAGVRWVSGTDSRAGLAPKAKTGLLPAGGGERGKGAGRRGRAQRPQPPTSAMDAGGETGGTVFVESQLDRTVERDPASAAPVYPEQLRRDGVSGMATVEFVVDTTGRPDTTSFAVVTATRAEFAAAVRDALPFMLFRPAELEGRQVRQLVRQDFIFRLMQATPDSTGADTASAPASADTASAPAPADSARAP